jgi:hypothetical protein
MENVIFHKVGHIEQVILIFGSLSDSLSNLKYLTLQA